MERAADWQDTHPSKHPPTSWTQGVYYTGVMALDSISDSPRFRQRMAAMGTQNKWLLGPKQYLADDQAVGQTYVELWRRSHDNKMIAPMQAQFDSIIAQPWKLLSLDSHQAHVRNLWSWCDALFMAPPAWARLSLATGDSRYMTFAVKNWWRTSNYLYDKNEQLYYRDSTFFFKRTPNGAKVFWSRGNGWALAGLARMMQCMPAGNADRWQFEDQFRQMAQKVATLQQPDGLWRVSLLDPADYNWKETSGSALFTYALAWGINENLLDRATYEPIVRRSWAALTACVTPDGMLTHVQQIGAAPIKSIKADATEVYGTGVFLLAGSEMYRLVK